MKIYFSCSITGGRNDQSIYLSLVDYLLKGGHDVPTAHLASADVLSLEAVTADREVFERDVNWVTQCDALIAEVSTPSHGVGYEIALACSLNKPILCCYREGRKVSKMLLGNSHPRMETKSYSTSEEALALVAGFILTLEQQKSMPL
jgi:nucleoside 2-deoxyribosyltransferase